MVGNIYLNVLIFVKANLVKSKTNCAKNLPIYSKCLVASPKINVTHCFSQMTLTAN